MPSQDDNLDELLNNISDEDEVIGEGAESGQAPDLGALAEMSEEEIERLLSAGGAGQSPQPGEAAKEVTDISGESGSSFQKAGSSDLQEIEELLQKADQKEVLEGADVGLESEDPAGKLLEEIERAGETSVAGEALNSKQVKDLEKKRLKEEKKAAREAAKAEKKEKRRAKKGKKEQHPQTGQEISGAGPKEIKEYDVVADRDLLDNIVTQAGKIERKEPPRQEGAGEAADLMEIAAALEAERDVDPSQEVPYEEEYAAADVSDADSGILALELDEVDNYIPDITANAEKEGKAKKQGMFSRFFAFLMEEDEEPENEDLPISDENQEIIREMDKEEAEKAKKKVQKKVQKKEKKKAAEKKKEKPPKKAKPPKPKKEKKPKEEEPYLGKKLTFKKMLPILLLGVTVGAATFLFVYLAADYSNKQIAKEAYAAGDYQTCYVNLYGKKRNEDEEMMYGKSESILYIQIWYEEYLRLEEEGGGAKALDCLIRVVNDFPALYENAFRWGAETEVNQVYTLMLDALSGKYGVSETQAREIAALKSDIAYTRAVMALAGEGGFGEENDMADSEGQQPSEEDSQETQPDELPEEADLEEGDFVED